MTLTLINRASETVTDTVEGMLAVCDRMISDLSGRGYSASRYTSEQSEVRAALVAMALVTDDDSRCIVREAIGLAIVAHDGIGPVTWAEIEIAIRVVTGPAQPTRREVLRDTREALIGSDTVEIPSDELARIISAR